MSNSVFAFCRDYYTNSELEAYLGNFPKRNQYNELLSDRILIVTCENETIVGFTQYDPSESAVDAIYVLPGHTGNGVGTRMLRYIEDVARSLKKDEINIVSSKNAVSFYEKSEYIFQNRFYITYKNGTKFESVKLIKRLNS